MIDIPRELDRALRAASASPDQAPNDETVSGDREPGGLVPRSSADASIHERVLAVLSCEIASPASFVARAELALYVSVDEKNNPHIRLLDLLCHLRHWAKANQIDFEATLREAEHHYSIERHDGYAAAAPLDSANTHENDDLQPPAADQIEAELDAFERLRAEVEAPNSQRPGVPRWRCPQCYSDKLMIHRPVWETGPIDQSAETDEPCFEWTDIFAEVRGVPIEFDCGGCERRLRAILRRKLTDPITYELWPSDAEEAGKNQRLPREDRA
jgi:hypothetical protein